MNKQNKKCADCGEEADEFYDDEWLCEDCIVLREFKK
jgi:NMD protein affecting ribosome stability and mRNA decay